MYLHVNCYEYWQLLFFVKNIYNFYHWATNLLQLLYGQLIDSKNTYVQMYSRYERMQKLMMYLARTLYERNRWIFEYDADLRHDKLIWAILPVIRILFQKLLLDLPKFFIEKWEKVFDHHFIETKRNIIQTSDKLRLAGWLIILHRLRPQHDNSCFRINFNDSSALVCQFVFYFH